jgi:uncharacterized protein involved in outer membrane biogenesis
MRQNMALRLPSRKTLALSLSGLIVVCLLLAWLALPRILQSQAEKFIEEKTGHQLIMDRPAFNPFELRLHLSGLHLARPDGAPLLAFREMVLDVSGASIFRRAFVFDDISLDGLEATIALLPNGQLNWSALLDSLKSKEETEPDAPLPRLDIRHFVLSDARLDFSDQHTTPAFATRIEPMNLELTDLSTFPNDKGEYKVSAHTAFGAQVEWHGELSLEPVAMTGSIRVANADIAKLASYVNDRLPIAPPAGIAGLSADYRLGYAAGKLDLNLEHVGAKLSGLKLHGKRDSDPAISIDSIEAKDGSFDLLKSRVALGALTVSGSSLDLQPDKEGAPQALQLGSLAFENMHVNLSSHEATLARIALKEGDIRAVRDATGRIDILEALQSMSTSPPPDQKAETASAPAQADWRYRVDQLELASFSATFRDESVKPSAELAFKDIAIGLEGISDDWTAAVPLQTSFKVRSGGSFTATGKVIPAAPSADIQLQLDGLGLAPAQPYLSVATNLKLADGKLSTAGRARYSAKGANYRGSFELSDLRLNEAETSHQFLALKSLGSRVFEVTPTKLEMDELAIAGLDTQLLIEKDKSVSIKRIMKQAATDAGRTPAETKPATPQAASAATATTPASAFLVNIDRLRFNRGELDFADYSLALPFATHIHDLHGIITGLSSRPGAPSQIELDGQVDDYGLARAAGQVEMFDPANLMDIKVAFRNIEMYRLTPYSATFAGRKIASGRLSLDLEYKIHQRQLQGENQVIMDQLTLGDRVESADAMSLPLDLAIAILEDADGRIDLGLPVSGSLDDPQFSYGRIVWKAIINVLTKIVTAPFRALGALFGGDEKVEYIAFETGAAQPTPPEREKLVKIAAALNKRPGLSLALHGVYAEQDRPALQEKQLRRSVAEKIGQQVEGDSDPGPVAMHQPKVQAALESLYAERFGSEERATLKDGFRKANPGQLEESLKDKMMSKLSGMFRARKILNEQEVAQLKGGDFYVILADRLRNSMSIDDTRLQALATARSESMAAILKTAGAPMERIEIRAAEKVETDGRDVPVKLVLGVAPRSAKP